MFSKLPSFKRSSFILLAAVFFTISACSEDDGYYDDDSFDQVAECSTIGQNRFVYDVLDQWYFWEDTLPNINPDNFDSPDALLDTLVANAPEVDRFSYITDTATSDAFFENGEFVGLGFTSQNIDNQLLLALVFKGSPADLAGLERGFEIVSVNNIDVATTLAAGNNVDFGSSTLGEIVDVVYKDLVGDTFETRIIKDNLSVDTIPVSSVIDNNGVATGYLHFYTFIEPSNAALANAFAEFNSANVSELIVDVRYNGGGLVSIAEYLAGLIGGTNTAGEVLADQLHNSKRAAENDKTIRFADQTNALDLDRVVFITAGGTASASELVINGLTPFLNVVLVGDTTFGKPVGQYGFDFCGNTLFPVAFETLNANFEGEYFDGLAVDCPADDDLFSELGDVNESSLAEALNYLDTGSCSSALTSLKPNKTQTTEKNKSAVIQQWKAIDIH